MNNRVHTGSTQGPHRVHTRSNRLTGPRGIGIFQHPLQDEDLSPTCLSSVTIPVRLPLLTGWSPYWFSIYMRLQRDLLWNLSQLRLRCWRLWWWLISRHKLPHRQRSWSVGSWGCFGPWCATGAESKNGSPWHSWWSNLEGSLLARGCGFKGWGTWL